MIKERFLKIGMIVGIIIVILGIVIFFNTPKWLNFDFTKSTAFGADYYTYQYEATQNAANNIITLGIMMGKYFDLALRYLGVFVSMIGLSITSAFGYLYSKNKELAKNAIEGIDSNNTNINKDVEDSIDEEVDTTILEDNEELIVEEELENELENSIDEEVDDSIKEDKEEFEVKDKSYKKEDNIGE